MLGIVGFVGGCWGLLNVVESYWELLGFLELSRVVVVVLVDERFAGRVAALQGDLCGEGCSGLWRVIPTLNFKYGLKITC